MHSHTTFALILILINQTRETSGEKMEKVIEKDIEIADQEQIVFDAKGVVKDLKDFHKAWNKISNVSRHPIYSDGTSNLFRIADINEAKEFLDNALDLNSAIQFHIQQYKDELQQLSDIFDARYKAHAKSLK